MSRVLFDSIDSWADGVNTSLHSADIPQTASPRALNSALYYFGAPPGAAVVGKRRGCRVMNRTAITGSPAVHGQHMFRLLSAGAFTTYHLLVSDGGRLDLLNADFTTSPADSTTPTPFSSGAYLPDFEVAQNACFIANGQASNNKKLVSVSGTLTVQNVGITRPAAPTVTNNDTGTDNMNGTYDVALTYLNNTVGHESSRSDYTSDTVVNGTLTVSWTAPSDAQVTHVRVHIRKQTLGAEAFRVTVGATPAPNAATGGFPVATTSTVLNLTNAQISALTNKTPNTVENDVPPTTNFWAFSQSRMFAAGDPTYPSYLYYSKTGLPEAFDSLNGFEKINPDDGQKITALHATEQMLLIFKRNATYVLVGQDPSSWTIRLLHPDIGCVAHRSIVTVEGITYWWSDRGPVRLVGEAGFGSIDLIGQPFIAPTISTETINPNQVGIICAAPDVAQSTVLWAVPETGQTVNSMILPFNYRLGRWISTKWDPLDVASLAVVLDNQQRPWVYLGGTGGQTFRWWASHNDGVTSGTVSGTVTSATTTTLTDTAAAFDTTGAGLAKRFVIATDTAGITQRRRIASNTATTLTLDTGLTWSTTPTSTSTYTIGGPNWELDTRWETSTAPYFKKRYEYLYLQTFGLGTATTITLDVRTSFNQIAAQTTNTTFAPASNTASGTWGVGHWGVMRWGALTQMNKRYHIGLTGTAWSLRLRNAQPNQPAYLLKAGMRSELLSDKIG